MAARRRLRSAATRKNVGTRQKANSSRLVLCLRRWLMISPTSHVDGHSRGRNRRRAQGRSRVTRAFPHPGHHPIAARCSVRPRNHRHPHCAGDIRNVVAGKAAGGSRHKCRVLVRRKGGRAKLAVGHRDNILPQRLRPDMTILGSAAALHVTVLNFRTEDSPVFPGHL